MGGFPGIFPEAVRVPIPQPMAPPPVPIKQHLAVQPYVPVVHKEATLAAQYQGPSVPEETDDPSEVPSHLLSLPGKNTRLAIKEAIMRWKGDGYAPIHGWENGKSYLSSLPQRSATARALLSDDIYT